MKIVKADNFDREGSQGNDVLIAENVNKFWGESITGLLNERAGKDSKDFFELVEDDYKLKAFQP
jgi:hypothetical protein